VQSILVNYHVAAAPQSVQRLHRDARESYEDCYFAVLMLSGPWRLRRKGESLLVMVFAISSMDKEADRSCSLLIFIFS
jgi:hypothetical protein